MGVNNLRHEVRFCPVRKPVQLKQDYATNLEPLADHQFAEIAIFSYQNAAFAFCYLENFPIRGARSCFRRGFHVVAGSDKALRYRARDVFVRQKTNYSAATTVSCCK
jgi:hypothetical protein